MGSCKITGELDLCRFMDPLHQTNIIGIKNPIVEFWWTGRSYDYDYLILNLANSFWIKTDDYIRYDQHLTIELTGKYVYYNGSFVDCEIISISTSC